MKIARKLIIHFILLFIAFINEILAQGIHHSLYEFVPTNQNPASSGFDEYRSKIGLIYRDQYFTVTPSSLKRISAAYDQKLGQESKKGQWIGGLRLHHHQAGAIGLNHNTIGLSGARTLFFNKKKVQLTLGLHGAYSDVSYNDISNLSLEEKLTTGVVTELLPFLNNKVLQYGTGIWYVNKIDRKFVHSIGYAINRLEAGSTLGKTALKDNMYLHDVQYILRKNDKNRYWQASVLGQKRNKAFETVGQVFMGWKLHSDISEVAIGLGYRHSDALQYMATANIGQIKIGIAYEQNISSLVQASNGVGGFEVAMTYVFGEDKKPPPKKKPPTKSPPTKIPPSAKKDEPSDSLDTVAKDTISLVSDTIKLVDKAPQVDTIIMEAPAIPTNAEVSRDSVLDFDIIVYFDFDQANIKDQYSEKLKELMIYLGYTDYRRIQLEAHTDCRGAEQYNERLSKKRVDSVAKWLIDQGIREHTISKNHKGESVPIVPCEPCSRCTEDQHLLNRRVEIKVWKN